jgi:hypothetical protein
LLHIGFAVSFDYRDVLVARGHMLVEVNDWAIAIDVLSGKF